MILRQFAGCVDCATRDRVLAGGARLGPSLASAVFSVSLLLHKSDFGQSARCASMSIVNAIAELALSNRTSSKSRVVARIAASASARSQDVLTD
jgi:hypothetical protein